MPVYHCLSPLYILYFSFLYFFCISSFHNSPSYSVPVLYPKETQWKEKEALSASSSQVPGLHRISDVQERCSEAKVRVPHQQGTKPGISYVTAFSKSPCRMRFRKDCQYCALQKKIVRTHRGAWCSFQAKFDEHSSYSKTFAKKEKCLSSLPICCLPLYLCEHA